MCGFSIDNVFSPELIASGCDQIVSAACIYFIFIYIWYLLCFFHSNLFYHGIIPVFSFRLITYPENKNVDIFKTFLQEVAYTHDSRFS
jgi:hypothetical protein